MISLPAQNKNKIMAKYFVAVQQQKISFQVIKFGPIIDSGQQLWGNSHIIQDKF